MVPLEHMYVRENWSAFYAGLYATSQAFESIDCQNPGSLENKTLFETVNDRVSFLDTLLSQQQLTVPGVNDRLSKISNTMTSLLSLFEDDEISEMSPNRLSDIAENCRGFFTHALGVSSEKHHKADSKPKPEAEVVKEEPVEIEPVLDKNSTFDNLRDAMRIIMQQSLKSENSDERARTEEVAMSPEQRLFLNIRRQQQIALSNLGTAVTLCRSQKTIQFADGLLAIQGFFDRKQLAHAPHIFVRIDNLRACIGSNTTDTMTPTVFLYDQKFAVFPRFKTADKKPNHEATARAIEKAEQRMNQSSFLKPFLTPHFPDHQFVWIPNAELVSDMELSVNVRAELSL